MAHPDQYYQPNQPAHPDNQYVRVLWVKVKVPKKVPKKVQLSTEKVPKSTEKVPKKYRKSTKKVSKKYRSTVVPVPVT